MRCPDCNKMVSYDTDVDPEIGSEEYDAENNRVTFDVRIVNNCGECGTELKEATFNADVEMPEIEHKPDCVVADREYSVEVSASRAERSETKSRARMFYGYEANIVVTCDSCGEHAESETHDEIQASSMDELV